MALNINVFEFLNDSGSRKASPDIKQKSPISPIESESSSGISSLDSDDLKVRNKLDFSRWWPSLALVHAT